ncbi:sporulation protein YqfD [Salibacterium halotolerans]|uniref:Similar to stage IV sporulation protein n=1 Tax=Salibacterium halotolerans TaxID=1884432 RepID=A0A1I5NGD6_9BACI|nr:sporulation protein YqfD [Salibacterium halotolerans]SFP20787.1 similar to stage IV sporulation protein [Salibacterium halotolerans]
MGKHKGWLSVRVRMTGERVEDAVNECIRTSLVLTDVKRVDSRCAQFYVTSNSLGTLEDIAHRTGCTLETVSPSKTDRVKTTATRRWGMAAGLGLFVLTLFLLSKMIWNVNIYGASPPLQDELENQLQEMGVKQGGFQFLVPDADMIQSRLMEEVEGATWIGMQQNGTTFQFEVAQQSLPEETDNPSPRHLTASKTAVIQRIFAEKGKPVVQENELVHEGDLLISGYIGEGEETEAVGAAGEVWGETWYEVTVSLPRERLQETLTGKEASAFKLRLFQLNLPIWGFQADEQFSDHVLNQKEYQLSVWNRSFPFSLRIENYQERRTTSQDTEDIITQTKKAATTRMERYLPEEASIISEKILHENARNGKVKLVMHYKVLEDIKSETPIIQGE